jgi:methionine-rich copper-binding protein CopC
VSQSPEMQAHERLVAEQSQLAQRLALIEHQFEKSLRAPSLRVVEFGEGKEDVQQFSGELDASYAGLAIFNPTAKKIQFDTTRRSSADTAMHVPAKSWLVWPVPFVDLTLAVAAAEAGGPVETVVVLRLWVPPPAPAAGAYS